MKTENKASPHVTHGSNGLAYLPTQKLYQQLTENAGVHLRYVYVCTAAGGKFPISMPIYRHAGIRRNRGLGNVMGMELRCDVMRGRARWEMWYKSWKMLQRWSCQSNCAFVCRSLRIYGEKSSYDNYWWWWWWMMYVVYMLLGGLAVAWF